MRTATYFPTYSQTENVVTNAVLVLMSQIHRIAPDVFSGLITKLIDEEYPIGPQFFNQVTDARGPGIPDGLIEQRPFQIYFETKLGDTLDVNQIERHFETIAKRPGEKSDRVLIGLTRKPIEQPLIADLKAKGALRGITFASTTFSELSNLVGQETAEFRLELNALIEEFRAFVSAQGLTEPSENWMLINPCGTSFEQNAKFHLYHDQPWRSKRYCKYLGCYRDKSVRLVGKVRKVVVAHFDEDQVVVDQAINLPWITENSLTLSQQDEDVIRKVAYASPYALRDETVRYYFVDRFVETNFVKTSRNGIQGHMYFQLDNREGGNDGIVPEIFQDHEPTIDEIAGALSGKIWS